MNEDLCVNSCQTLGSLSKHNLNTPGNILVYCPQSGCKKIKLSRSDD